MDLHWLMLQPLIKPNFIFKKMSTTYLDLATNQTIGGVKTFSSPPVMSSITNGAATLTLPTTTGTLLTSTGLPVSSTGYAAYYLSAPQTLTNLVTTTVEYDASFATDSGITNSPNGTFTINTTGLYTFSASVDFVLVASAGLRAMWFELNGGVIKYCLVLTTGYTGFDTVVNSTFTAKLTAGDVIKVKVVQVSGGFVNLVGYSSSGGTAMCMIQITRVS